MELDEKVIRELKKLPTGNIADNNPHGGVMDAGICPVDPSLHMIGRAFTVKGAPGDNLAIYHAIHQAEKGDVLVVDCGGFMHGGHFGDMMANACMQKGIAGVIIDGTTRDREDIRELHFPVYSRGFCAEGTKKNVSGVMNVPVVCGNVLVRPGDLIFGDGDSAVVIPQEEEDEVIQKALGKYEHEKEVLKEISGGRDILDIYGF